MRYLTGLRSPRAWRLFAGAAILDLLQPWRRMRVIRTGPIWNPEHQRRVYGIIDRYMRENPEAGYFGRRFAWKDPLPLKAAAGAPGAPAGKGSGRASGRSTRFFGEELGAPSSSTPQRDWRSWNGRAAPATSSSSTSSAPFLERRQTSRTGTRTSCGRMSPCSRWRPGPRPGSGPTACRTGPRQPPSSGSIPIAPCGSPTAGTPAPTSRTDGEPRFGIVLNARVYRPQQLAEAVVTS